MVECCIRVVGNSVVIWGLTCAFCLAFGFYLAWGVICLIVGVDLLLFCSL